MATDVKVYEGVKIADKSDAKTGRMCKLIMNNDDTTPMDFVVLILLLVFNKSGEDAMKLMLSAHINGKVVVEILPRKLAQIKQREAIDMARSAGFMDFTIDIEGV